jgi:hypothetical protein
VNRKRIIYSDDEILTEEFFNIDWDSLRIERDVALVKCDWRFMSDQSPSQEWVDYREFLRNLPQNHFDESDEVTQGANAAADAWNEYDKPE